MAADGKHADRRKVLPFAQRRTVLMPRDDKSGKTAEVESVAESPNKVNETKAIGADGEHAERKKVFLFAQRRIIPRPRDDKSVENC